MPDFVAILSNFLHRKLLKNITMRGLVNKYLLKRKNVLLKGRLADKVRRL